MLTLQLLRHAKSSWATTGQDDFERPLNRRGIRDSLALGDYLVRTETIPDTMMVSSAMRTRETWLHLTTQLPEPPKLISIGALYASSPAGIIEEIQIHGETAQTLMVVAHNPGIESLAHILTKNDPTGCLPILQFKYPTLGLTTLTFEFENWAELKPQTAELMSFTTPNSRS